MAAPTATLAGASCAKKVRVQDAEKSPVLKAMLASGMVEDRERRIRLPWLESARSLRALAHWLGQDKPRVDSRAPLNTLVDLVRAADFLLLDNLLDDAARCVAAQLAKLEFAAHLPNLGRRATFCILLRAPPAQLLYAEDMISRSPFWTPRERAEALSHAWLRSGADREELLAARMQRDLQNDPRGSQFLRDHLGLARKLCLRHTMLSAEQVANLLPQTARLRDLDLSHNEWTGQDLMRVLPILFDAKLGKSSAIGPGEMRRPRPPQAKPSLGCGSPRGKRPLLRTEETHQPCLALRLANVGMGLKGVQALCKFSASTQTSKLAAQRHPAIHCEQLDISDNPRLGDLAVCKLAESLGATSLRIVELCLDRNPQLNDAALLLLVKAARSSKCAALQLRRLSLRHLAGRDVGAVLTKLYAPPIGPTDRAPGLVALDLGYAESSIGVSALETLTIATRPSLRELVLSGNRLDEEAGSAFVRGLDAKRLPALVVLGLASMSLSKHTVDQLCATPLGLERLDIARNALPCTATARFAQLIAACPSLSSIDLSGNAVNVYVAAALGAALGPGRATCLKSLCIDAPNTSVLLRETGPLERMGPHGCAALCRGLLAAGAAANLAVLSLASQGIQCRGAALVASVLPELANLHELNLRDNSIRDDGASALLVASRDRPDLQVCLADNLLSCEMQAQAESRARNSSL